MDLVQAHLLLLGLLGVDGLEALVGKLEEERLLHRQGHEGPRAVRGVHVGEEVAEVRVAEESEEVGGGAELLQLVEGQAVVLLDLVGVDHGGEAGLLLAGLLGLGLLDLALLVEAEVAEGGLAVGGVLGLVVLEADDGTAGIEEIWMTSTYANEKRNLQDKGLA